MNNYRLSFARTWIFTLLALIAFAANSVLCRLALGNNYIDASSFTAIRLFSGVLALFIIMRINYRKNEMPSGGSWFSGMMLFLYAITFSFAYISLDTGTGALVLFGSVQLTMVILSVLSGYKLHVTEWVGMSIAFGGLIFLVLPDVTTPSFMGFLLMATAGVAWGLYTFKGRSSENPLADTYYNFYLTTSLTLILLVVTYFKSHYSLEGIALAILSGAIASGIGYAVWYLALSGLSAMQAAVVQLSVPVIAAFGGVVFVSELITLRLILSASLILGGILLVLFGRHYIVQIKLDRNTA